MVPGSSVSAHTVIGTPVGADALGGPEDQAEKAKTARRIRIILRIRRGFSYKLIKFFVLHGPPRASAPTISFQMPNYRFFAASAMAARSAQISSQVFCVSMSAASFCISSGTWIFCGQTVSHWPQPMQAEAFLSSSMIV